MRAAGNVQEQPVRAVTRDQRRVTVAPGRERVQQRAIGGLVMLDAIELRAQGARVPDRLAGKEPARVRVRLVRDDPERIAPGADNDDRGRIRSPLQEP